MKPQGKTVHSHCVMHFGSHSAPMRHTEGEARPGSGAIEIVTGLRAFLLGLSRLRDACRRDGRSLSIVLFDFDGFRRCNEQHSQTFGNLVLQRFSSILTEASRDSDLVGRIYADRFVVALPGAGIGEARDVASHCRAAMRREAMRMEEVASDLDVSYGIAESTASFRETEVQLLHRARIALERAKHRTRHRTGEWDEAGAGPMSVAAISTPQTRFIAGDGSRCVETLRRHLRATYRESTQALVSAVDAKDPHTRTHSVTVAAYAEELARRLGLPTRLIHTLRAAALLHDVGKIGVPDAILTKPGSLTSEEFAVIQRHPAIALEILNNVSFLRDERPYILHHHERYDGKGYPAGLVGERIPIGARIIAVADALDTMLSPRAYKQPYTTAQVRHEFRSETGRQFDPVLVDHVLRWLDETPRAAVRTVSASPASTRG